MKPAQQKPAANTTVASKVDQAKAARIAAAKDRAQKNGNVPMSHSDAEVLASAGVKLAPTVSAALPVLPEMAPAPAAAMVESDEEDGIENDDDAESEAEGQDAAPTEAVAHTVKLPADVPQDLKLEFRTTAGGKKISTREAIQNALGPAHWHALCLKRTAAALEVRARHMAAWSFMAGPFMAGPGADGAPSLFDVAKVGFESVKGAVTLLRSAAAHLERIPREWRPAGGKRGPKAGDGASNGLAVGTVVNVRDDVAKKMGSLATTDVLAGLTVDAVGTGMVRCKTAAGALVFYKRGQLVLAGGAQ